MHQTALFFQVGDVPVPRLTHNFWRLMRIIGSFSSLCVKTSEGACPRTLSTGSPLKALTNLFVVVVMKIEHWYFQAILFLITKKNFKMHQIGSFFKGAFSRKSRPRGAMMQDTNIFYLSELFQSESWWKLDTTKIRGKPKINNKKNYKLYPTSHYKHYASKLASTKFSQAVLKHIGTNTKLSFSM